MGDRVIPRSSMTSLSRILILMLALTACVCGEDRVFKQPSDFIKSAFANKLPGTSVLNLSAEQKQRAKGIMSHSYKESRVRYWKQGQRSAWILEEIGKTQPITTGIIIENHRIKSVEILIYRESHGWEVSKPFFTEQFANAKLKSADQLSSEVKNVAGATLSVRAVIKLARLALYFDSLG